MAQSMTFDVTAVVSAELLESVTSRESARSLPIGVEAAQEAKVEEPCGVSCARIREEVASGGHHGQD